MIQDPVLVISPNLFKQLGWNHQYILLVWLYFLIWVSELEAKAGTIELDYEEEPPKPGPRAKAPRQATL